MVTYEYKGLLVRVPESTKYIVAGPDGVIRGYPSRPDLNNLDALVHSSEAVVASIVNYNESILETAVLKKFEPIVIHEAAAPNARPYEIGDTLTLQARIDEDKARSSEVHIVVNCYTPGSKPWTQILHVKVNGLSIDNIILTTVTEILYEYRAV